MLKEWHKKDPDGKWFFDAGFGNLSAVGTRKPGDTVPDNDGLRLVISDWIDRWWELWRALCGTKKKKRAKK